MPSINLPTVAKQDAIKAKTDLIGSPNPTTADTSTVMNYLKQLENKIALNTVPYSGTLIKNTYTTTSGINTELLVTDVTGKGIFHELYFYSEFVSTTPSMNLRIVLDGVTYCTLQIPKEVVTSNGGRISIRNPVFGTTISANSSWWSGMGTNVYGSSGDKIPTGTVTLPSSNDFLHFGLKFNSSLKIYIMNGSSSGKKDYVGWYELS